MMKFLFTHIKVFGCLAFVNDHSLPKDKFRARIRPCVFMGYLFGKNGWRFFNPQENKFLKARDTIFYETIFPFAKNLHNFHSIEPPDFSTQINFGESLLGQADHSFTMPQIEIWSLA